MGRDTVAGRAFSEGRPTRRELLAGATATAVGMFARLGSASGQQAASAPVATQPRATTPAACPWWMGEKHPRSRVVDVRSDKVLNASVPDLVALGELLDEALCSLTETATPQRAWRSVLGTARRIVVKLNSVGADAIGTSDAMVRVLVGGMKEAGYDPGQIALVEAPQYLTGILGTREPPHGWGSPIVVGGNPEPLAAYLHEADALINVPFLKTHQIAGMSACLKNLSHALIRHPARYHDNGCSPYVGQVVGTQEVSSKLKLNVVNALRVVVNNGPDARQQDIVGYGGLLLGFDPVAVDTVGLEMLAVERRRGGLTGGRLDVRYLSSAGEAGVGHWRPGRLERVGL